ncbi:MAG TPA: hypothetical protein VM182_12555 [Terriglobia bacterium]|nr:hypothetical protein [Terriglobia bacterium]
MHSDLTIQDLWLRLLEEARKSGETRVEKVEDGYYLVARSGGENGDAESTSASDDYSALGSRIPNLCRTRAVYLNLGGSYDVRDVPNPRQWLGDAAGELESGTLHAFAVVDTEIFSRRIAWELLTRGWTMEEVGHDLEVKDGRFKAHLNLLRAIVRMVLSRSNMAEASRSVISELSSEFSRHAGFYVRFQKRFEMFQPDVLDHYFVAYPDASCVALAWDYWELAGLPADEAERIFNEGVGEFEQLLRSPVGTWLPGVSLDTCAVDSYQN